jgi:hypothetical protein
MFGLNVAKINADTPWWSYGAQKGRSRPLAGRLRGLAGGFAAWPIGRWRRRRIELCQRRAHRVEARGAGEPVCLDGAPDCRRYGCVLVVGKIDCRHG